MRRREVEDEQEDGKQYGLAAAVPMYLKISSIRILLRGARMPRFVRGSIEDLTTFSSFAVVTCFKIQADIFTTNQPPLLGARCWVSAVPALASPLKSPFLAESILPALDSASKYMSKD